MLHVFHIHSNTCYISAFGVIHEHSIPNEDVIFILCRNLPILHKEIKCFRIDDDLYYFPFLRNNQLHNFKFLHSKDRIREIDSMIENEIDQEFIYYVHNSRNYLYRIIITHHLCKEVRFIEDGLDMYLDRKEFDRKYPVKVWLRHKIINFVLGHLLGIYRRIHQPNQPFHNKSTETPKIYGLTDLSFQKFIDPSYEYKSLDTQNLQKIQDYKLKPGTNVFVLTALVEQHVAKPNEVEALLKWYVEKFNINEVKLNFHPHQSQNTRKHIVSVFEKNSVKVEIIPDEIIMEVLFINNHGLNVFGTGTSLLIYATIFSPSSKVYALYPFFKKHLNRNTIRTIFWENTFSKIRNDNFNLYLRDFE
ncbi:polysialyltransferase family glycosyltransferase [Reichenbachiella sp.]|uniref:polysialyltransferase family glycosyltransferase n=1 Tax=Reichenbachiella sp. TaxID=2184521 RepID=UPI003BB1CA3F